MNTLNEIDTYSDGDLLNVTQVYIPNSWSWIVTTQGLSTPSQLLGRCPELGLGVWLEYEEFRSHVPMMVGRMVIFDIA